MFTISNTRKAWLAGFLGTMLVFIGQAVLDPETVPLDVVTDPDKWIMAFFTACLVWLVPNTPSSSATLQSVTWPIGLALLLLLAACNPAEQPEVIDRATAVAICSSQALTEGLVFATTEYNVYMAGCLSDILADIIIDEVILPQGLEKL